MPKLILILVMLTFTCMAQAQVYKCTGADGSVSFTDKPCNGNAEIVNNTDPGTSGLGAGGGSSGPASSLTLTDGSIQPFKKIISIEVKTQTGYKTGRKGMHVFYEGTDHLVEFENLVSMTISTWDRKSCGNTAHLCEPRVRIKTKTRELTARYEALRNIKILIDDKLDGTEKELTVWFGNKNRPHIRSIRF